MQILATSFDHHHHQNSIKNGYFSESACLLLFTTPLIAGPLMSLTHSIALYCELILRSVALIHKHFILMASHKLIKNGLWALFLWPLALALFSALPTMSSFHAVCYRPWTITYWYIIMAVMASLTAFLLVAILLQWIRKR